MKEKKIDTAFCFDNFFLQNRSAENKTMPTDKTDSHKAKLEKEGDGRVIFSLANVLRLRRPVVIMDEAHNARTLLSFDTLRRFNPSCVIELTATPETKHNPTLGHFASNILHHVSARELKAAEIIKLPVKLWTRPDWQQVLADAIAFLDCRVIEPLVTRDHTIFIGQVEAAGLQKPDQAPLLYYMGAYHAVGDGV